MKQKQYLATDEVIHTEKEHSFMSSRRHVYAAKLKTWKLYFLYCGAIAKPFVIAYSNWSNYAQGKLM